MNYISIDEERYYQLLTNEEHYKTAFGLLRDLLPKKEEIEEISKWDSDKLQGLFEEVDYTLRSLKDEVR